VNFEKLYIVHLSKFAKVDLPLNSAFISISEDVFC